MKKARLQVGLKFCILNLFQSGCSAAWLARLPWAQEVPGSNPGIPTSHVRENFWQNLFIVNIVLELVEYLCRQSFIRAVCFCSEESSIVSNWIF